mmetsp:Transcript_34540/g.75601  ORF Transcript_34540/g.75601 Transcript_34540/m.75601 type:complete len:611 (-) Transcript_34540:109-1941(-)|eukprot:CAMPEP_0178515260 /NCGR_PEP_ID=MMETSP0696-20121128/24462_1 /TAXON_ID=265572 /ORGANISM="Extubocellulus spinifer, Strain CCMP396" /LENGTH=610 /DNA_ID=CAMNT_0020145411 /DNA_START=116 /DNA_END=1948 /DNA_ORIENTATION=+
MIILQPKSVLALVSLVSAGRIGIAHADTGSTAATCVAQKHQQQSQTGPFVPAKTLVNGEVLDVYATVGQAAQMAGKDKKTMTVSKMVDVAGCCSFKGGESADAESCPTLEPVVIGQSPQFTTEQALSVLDTARAAWNGGSGEWTQMSLKERTLAIEKFVFELKKRREDIVEVLMWEIGKNRKDAESEFDRTVEFINEVIAAIRAPDADEYNSYWQKYGSTNAFVRRAAIGVIMCLGPYNYPLNETYATMIPALLMGNIVIMKIPTIGGLVHTLTMDAFAKALPPGAINFISGGGRVTMPPLMQTGNIDGLAFIGGSAAADDLIRKHPEPHRLKIFLQLEAKNMAIFMSDLFKGEESKAALDHAIKEAVSGGLSYNGQRCTALKLMFAPKGDGELVANKIAAAVEAMNVGLPWQTFQDDEGKQSYSQITPLPNMKRVEYMQSLIADATSKGAKIMNANGGSIVGGPESSLMTPAVLYPVTPDMDLYHEEQFGPVVPVAEYDDIDTVLEYARNGKFAQQASIFTATGDDGSTSMLIDRFSSVFGKININGSCGRSPDSLPFSGRRSSAMGVMSITEALREFSVPTVVSYKENSVPENVVESIQENSSFMQNL